MQRPHRVSLNANWRFRLFNAPIATSPTGWDAWQRVDLPHSWNALDTMEPDHKGHYRRGVGAYVCSYQPPPLPAGHRLWLEIEAASQKAQVFLGQKEIGRHAGGYTAFTLELPARLERAQPLLIQVDNRPDPDLIPSDMSDFFLYGGLTRNIWLYTTGPARLKHLFFDMDAAQEVGTLNLRGSILGDGDDLRLDVHLLDPAGEEVWRLEQRILSKDFHLALPRVPHPQLWSPERPVRYTAKLRLLSGHHVWDEVHTRLGFRFFDFPEGGPFYLNGQRLLLCGTHRHEDWAGYASAMPEPFIRHELKMIRDAGFNFIRLGHYPQAPAVLDACDELGLLVWEELPWCRGGVGGPNFREQTRSMLREMIQQHYNHPSIIFWGLGNELDWESEHPESDDAQVLAFLQALHHLAHQLDPHRLTVLRRFEPGAAVVDVYSPSIWSGWYRGRYEDYERVITAATARYPRLIHAEWGGDSHPGRHNSGPHMPQEALDFLAHELDHSETPGLALSDQGPYRPSRDSDWSESYMLDVMEWHLQVQSRFSHLAGTLQWIFKDFGTPLRPENPVPYVNQKGLVDRAGRPKDLYYLFRAYQTSTPTCYIESPTWPVRVGSPDEPQRIRVYANCPRVELFLNGVSQGKKQRDTQAFPAAGLVWWAKMCLGENTIRAVGHCEDGSIIEHTIHQTLIPGSTGDPAGWAHQVEQMPHPLDKGDALRVTVQMVDAAGRPVVDQERRVKFYTPAPGWLLNLGIPDASRVVETANGRAAILLAPPPKASFPLTIEAEGLPPATILIEPNFLISISHCAPVTAMSHAIPTPSISTLTDALALSLNRVRANRDVFDHRFPITGYPIYQTTANENWITGFWPGMLWLAYHATEDVSLREKAESLYPSFVQRLEQRVRITHDMGFIYLPSCRAQWMLTGDEQARATTLRAAQALARRFNPHGGYIQAWGEIGEEPEAGRIIIDSMMNLNLLYWASASHIAAPSHARGWQLLSHLLFQSPNRGTPVWPHSPGLRGRIRLVSGTGLGHLRLCSLRRMDWGRRFPGNSGTGRGLLPFSLPPRPHSPLGSSASPHRNPLSGQLCRGHCRRGLAAASDPHRQRPLSTKRRNHAQHPGKRMSGN